MITAAIFLGFTLGVLLFFSPGSLAFIFLAIIIILLINKISDEKERGFIKTIFMLGLGARIFFVLITMGWAIFNNNILNYAWRSCPDYSTPYIIDDSGYYTLRGLFTNMHWLGMPLSAYTINAVVMNSYGFSGFIYVLAFYFMLFGYSPISSRFINCFLASVTIILIYYITKSMFGKKAGQLAAIITAFFPSLFLWSITNLKESSFIFSIYLMFWSIHQFKTTRKFYHFITIVLAMASQFFIRSGYKEFLYITVVVVLFDSLFLLLLNLCAKKRVFNLLIIFMALFLIISLNRDKMSMVVEDIKKKSLIQHRGALSEGGICYQLLPDEQLYKINISNAVFLQMLGNGWIHIMLEPFPWRFQSKPMLFGLFQMVLWYGLLFFAFRGMGILVRYKAKESMIFISYFFIISSALAVMGGNIGTTFRFRDIITPLILMFSSVGLINAFSRTEQCSEVLNNNARIDAQKDYKARDKVIFNI